MILENIVFVIAVIVFLYLWFISIKTILSTRQEGPRRRAYLDDKLIKELREVISKGGGNVQGDIEEPLTNILKDIYDDLYGMISDEETERKKETQELKTEIQKLKGELEKFRER